MRVARLYGVRDIRVSEEPIPAVEPGTSLVKVTAVGLCGSDLHWYEEAGIGAEKLDRPLVIGHEFAGVIEGGPRHGQPVAVDPAIACASCEMCHAGHPNLCPTVRFAGHGTFDGALREFVAWPTALLHPLPEGLSNADGAMLEPLGVAIHGLDLAHPRIGMSVAVIGCGPIGLLLIQAARAAGAGVVVAADPLPHRREAAARFGADHVFDPASATDPQEWFRGATGLGVDVAFEVGGADEAVHLAMIAARPGARVLFLGIPDNDRTTFRAGLARRKGLTLLMVRRMKDVYPRAIALAGRGVIDVASLVTARYPLDQVATAFEIAASRHGLKTIVEP